MPGPAEFPFFSSHWRHKPADFTFDRKPLSRLGIHDFPRTDLQARRQMRADDLSSTH